MYEGAYKTLVYYKGSFEMSNSSHPEDFRIMIPWGGRQCLEKSLPNAH